MPLIHNQTSLPLEAGKTLFDYADDLAVRVPTSCNRNGECHECIVEVRQGMDALEPLNDTEDFLRDNYRLACQARVIDIEADIEFNVLRRQPRILTESISTHRHRTRPPNRPRRQQHHLQRRSSVAIEASGGCTTPLKGGRPKRSGGWPGGQSTATAAAS